MATRFLVAIQGLVTLVSLPLRPSLFLQWSANCNVSSNPQHAAQLSRRYFGANTKPGTRVTGLVSRRGGRRSGGRAELGAHHPDDFAHILEFHQLIEVEADVELVLECAPKRRVPKSFGSVASVIEPEL